MQHSPTFIVVNFWLGSLFVSVTMSWFSFCYLKQWFLKPGSKLFSCNSAAVFSCLFVLLVRSDPLSRENNYSSAVAREYETCLFGFIHKWLILTGRIVKFKASIGKWGVMQVVLISWFAVWLDIICQVEWNWFFSIRCSLRHFFYLDVLDPQFRLSGYLLHVF